MRFYAIEGQLLIFAVDSINEPILCRPAIVVMVVLDGSSSLCHYLIHCVFG